MSTAGILQIEILAGIARLSEDMKRAERIVGDSTGKMEKSVVSLQSQFNKLGFGLSIGLMIDSARRLSDEFTKVTAQMRIATATQSEYAKGMEDVRRISTTAQASITATTMLYTRLTNSLKQHGATQQDVGRITESVSLGLKAYGATTAEASSAMLQLSQAFGSGRLGGEEFRAVAESMPNMLAALAKSMNVPASSLKQLASEGKITSEVMMKAWNDPALIAGLTKQAEMTRTITGELTVFRNNLTMLVGEFMGASGSTGGITSAISAMSDAVLVLAENLKTIITLTTILGIAYAGKYAVGLAMSIEKTIALADATAMNAAINLRASQQEAALAAAKVATASATAASTVSLLRNTIVTVEANTATLAKTVADNAATIAQLNHARSVAQLSGHYYIIRQVEAELVVTTQALAVAQTELNVSTARQARLQAALIAEDRAALKSRADLVKANAAVVVSQNAVSASAIGSITAIAVAIRAATMAHPIIAATTAIAAIVVAIANWDAIVKSSKASLSWFQNEFLGGMEFLAAGVGISLGELVQKLSLLATVTVPQLKSGEFKKQWDELGKLAEQSRIEAAARIAGIDKQTVDHEKLAAAERYAADRKDWEKLTNTKAQQRQAEIEALNEHYLKIVTGQRLTQAEQLSEATRYNVALANINNKYRKDENKEWKAFYKANADIDKDRLYKAFEEDKAGRIAHSQYLLTVEMSRIKDTALAEKEANQETAAAAIREYMRRGEASDELNAEYVAQQKALAKAEKERYKMIDGFAHDAFDNIFDKGKNAFEEIGKVIKKSILDMLYKMTVQKWIFSIGVTSAGVGASSMAGAAGLGNYGGGTGLMDIASSGLGMAMSGLTATQSLTAASAYGSAALSATSLAEGISMATSGLSLAMPYIGAALAVYSLFSGKKSTPTTSLGHAVTSFSATGVQTGTQSLYGGSSAGVDAQIASLQTGYMKAAMALGIGATAQQWGFAMNTGANGQRQMFGLSGGGFEQTETAFSDVEVQLAASRAVFSALQGSELPQYLSRMFDGLTAGAMTQQDIDNTLAFAGSVKQMRDALLETRAPLEVLRANIDAGTEAFATSAETFRTDFVAAIDAGISPQVFEQWKALGTAIDQLAAADAEVAAQNAEALARAAEDTVRYQTTMLDLQAQIVELTGDTVMAEAVLIEQRKIAIAELNASDPTGYLAALTNQLWGLQDAADAAAIAADDAAIAAQAAADAFELITSSLEVALDDARNILRASIDAEKSALQAAYETELATAKARVDSVGESVRKLTDLSSLLKSTVTSMAVGVTRESAQAQLSAALAAARAGGALPSADSLHDAIRTLSQPSESKFGSYFDYMRDFITTSNDIAALAELTDDQLTEQEQTLILAQDSLEMLTLTYDANILRLDGIWEEATGIRYAVIDVATALANFQAATGAVAAAPQVQGLVNQQIAAVQAAGVDPSTYNAMAVTSVASQLESSIADMYQSILGRTADVSGLSAWASSGLSLSMIESQIAASAEAQARAISVGAQNTMIEAVNAALGTTTNIRAYAIGSNFIDRDQLAMLHRGETVTPAPFVDRERAAREETNALLSRLLESNNETKAELKAAKAELTAIKKSNEKMWQIDDKWDIEGTPAVRT